MIEHPNSLLVHHCLQAASEGDRETLRALWAPDIVWHIKGRSPWRGDVKGADRILEYLAEIGSIGVAGLHTEVEDVMVSNDRAAMICHARATIGDRLIDADYLIIANINGRRIQEITSVPVDPDRAAEFWVNAAETMPSRSSPFLSA
jgi:ketosteroid isomerase-like protein